ncbi:MAG TPA: hypothetical protein VK427_01575 [Kofleriaceae bacterium]|nr:hypothetical protein [Kofleriaceae bacterium]
MRQRASESDAYDPNTDRSSSAVVHVPVDVGVEDAILAIFDDPRADGESHVALFDRKERALCELFETLSPSAALALDRRLAVGKRDDLLAAKFRGLVVERRDRLRAVLGRVRRTR